MCASARSRITVEAHRHLVNLSPVAVLGERLHGRRQIPNVRI